ncbi:MAG: iron-containing alcohol dehydrogenase [Lachnospiraceae bacterium]|nr:iron-containing alcohol dehydrogenase [Lachnospiraceae bacterium]
MSGKYFVTHGAANYVFFESAMRMYNETDPDGKIAQLRRMICEAFGTAGTDADAKAFDTLFDAVTQLLPPKKMHEYGVKEEDIDLFTESVFANQMRLVDNAYIKMTPELVRRLYVESY